MDRLLDAIRRRFGVALVIVTDQSQVGDFGEHLNDVDFYTALKEISRDVGVPVRETDYLGSIVRRMK